MGDLIGVGGPGLFGWGGYGGNADEEGGEEEGGEGWYEGNEYGGDDEVGGYLSELFGAEEGGRKKRRSLFRRRRRGGRGAKRCPPCPTGIPGANTSVIRVAARGTRVADAGVALLTIPRQIPVIFPGIDLAYRVPKERMRDMLDFASYDAPIEPVVAQGVTPAVPGPYTFNLLPPVGTRAEASIITLDVGVNTFTTFGGGPLNFRVQGTLRNRRPYDSGETQILIPSTVRGFRIFVVPFTMVNNTPTPAMATVRNQYLEPGVAPDPVPVVQAPDSAGDVEAPVLVTPVAGTTPLTISGSVSTPGLTITATLITPTNPFWGSVMAALRCNCS